MAVLGEGVLVLFGLLVPVHAADTFLTEPVLCYLMDGVLIIYCIIATALFFKERYSRPPVACSPSNNNQGESGVYQELQRPEDTCPYEVLEIKAKKQPRKKNKSKSAQAEDRHNEASGTLMSDPPLSPD